MITPRHPRYRLPDEKEIGSAMLENTRETIAGTAAAGDTVLPIEIAYDPIPGWVPGRARAASASARRRASPRASP